MEMKRILAVGLSLGLIAAALVGPAHAARKKLTPSSASFFLHWDPPSAGQEDCDGLQHMDLEDTPGDTSCSFIFQPAQEALVASGQEPLSYVWPASGGLPLTLNASKKITGEFAMKGTFRVQTYVEWVLSGSTGGDFVDIASGQTEPHNAGPLGDPTAPGPVILKIEGKASKKLDKKVFTSLQLMTTIRGYASAYVSLDDPGSFITVPTYKK
ncbi:MAG: hypothetical protein ACR2L3_04490 [Actinomycetota bacterium]